MILASDVGYGYVKYAFKNSEGKFPTLIAPVSGTEEGDFGEDKSYEFNGRRYLVGENAFYASNVVPTRSDGFLLKYTPLCLYHIFKRENLVRFDKVVVSLSIAEYREKKEELKRKCENFFVDGVQFSPEVLVMPQGLGIWVNLGKPSNAVIVDVGFNTVDVIVFLDGRPRREYNIAFTDRGVCNITDAISDYLSKKFGGIYINQDEAEEVLAKGYFNLRRNKIHLEDFVSEQKELFSESVISVVINNAKLKNISFKIDEFIVAGGGAYYLSEQVINKYGIRVPDKPEFANVLGFLKTVEEESGQDETGN